MSQGSAEGVMFEMRYRQALTAYLADEAEEARLMGAFELGRAALGEGYGLLDLLALHHASVSSLLGQPLPSDGICRRLDRANEFLTQVIAPFEMAYRGWTDMVDRLRHANEELEKQVAQRTAAHREAEERLHRAQQIAGIGSWEVDLETGDQIWSKELYRLFGLPEGPPAAASNDIAAFVHEGDRAQHERWFAQLEAGQDPEPVEYRIRRPDGEYRVMRAEGEAIAAANGKVSRISCTLQDITEGKAAEARLHELQTELAHVSRLSTIGHMASALAHELNQPLTALTNYLEASRLRLANSPDERTGLISDTLGRAVDQALRAGQIIRRLREFVARGETEKRIESIKKLVDDACALALLVAKDQSVRVKLQLDPSIDAVVVDKVQIQQVLLNLLRNAIEAMRASVRRELVVSTTPAADGMVSLSVADTGPGIAADLLPKLFQPFVTTKREGMGIGLSLSRTIIESHGGQIMVEPNPVGGAIFRLTLRGVGQ
jgi:two-component system sensor kinase FixL